MDAVHPAAKARSDDTCLFDPATAPVVMVAIADLEMGESPRLSSFHDDHAQLLCEVEQPLPPIIVHRPGLRVIDGMHRIRAAVLRGENAIRAQLFDGSDDAAFLLAVRNNITHGLPLTLVERRAAARRILCDHPDWSDRMVAVSAGVSDKTVASVRREAAAEVPQLTVRVGTNGRVCPLDREERRRHAAELITEHPRASLREIANRAGISINTARDVRTRVGRGEDPAPSRRRAGRHQTFVLPEARMASVPSIDRSMPDVQQCLTTLDRLRHDPSLRFSESGRNLVRSLYAGINGPDQAEAVIDSIPVRWVEAVAEAARGCAEAWQRFADACDQRARRAG